MSTAAAKSHQLRVHPNLRGVFCGSGGDGMSDPRLADCILRLLPEGSGAAPNVLYLGTATYDLEQFGKRQTECLQARGCTIRMLKVVDQAPSAEEIAQAFQQADILVVGGGNTLFAMDRWKKMGLVPHLQQAMERGCILTGGSAGAICWFDGGHSDSMDPDTYKVAMLKQYGESSAVGETTVVLDESSAPSDETAPPKQWQYIRVPGLGYLPGLMCPHHDRVQSNGVLRAHDFDNMMLRHAREVGIGMDHWAALVVDGPDSYRVLSLEGKPGSVLHKDGSTASFSPEAEGVPGIWIKQVTKQTNGSTKVETRLCPPSGKLSDILRPTVEIVQDSDEMDSCRQANPDDGPEPQV